MNFSHLSSTHLEVLREVGNIGMGNALTSMSQMINKRVDMKMPTATVVTFDEIMEVIGGPDEVVAAMLFRIQGEARGTVFFILSVEEAEKLVEEVSGGISLSLLSGEEPEALTISVLTEIGNIMTGSYLSALSDFLKIQMLPSIPYLAIDLAGSIITTGLVEVSNISDYAIIINTEIMDSEQNGIHGHFLLIPEHDTLETIFSALGVNGYE